MPILSLRAHCRGRSATAFVDRFPLRGLLPQSPLHPFQVFAVHRHQRIVGDVLPPPRAAFKSRIRQRRSEPIFRALSKSCSTSRRFPTPESFVCVLRAFVVHAVFFATKARRVRLSRPHPSLRDEWATHPLRDEWGTHPRSVEKRPHIGGMSHALVPATSRGLSTVIPG